MKNQYLLIAENIIYRNTKLTCINIFDHFVAVKLPAEFTFDMVVICGPGWDAGKHEITMNAVTDGEEQVEIGKIEFEIPNENFVYNAIAHNLKLGISDEVKDITFIVNEGDEEILRRTYSINTILSAVTA